MTEVERATPHILSDLDDTGIEYPPIREPKPGARRETLIHWIITVGGFTAMLLIGLLFTM